MPSDAIIWLSPAQLPVARALVERAGLAPVRVVCDDPSRSAEMAQALGCEPGTDLRSALASAGETLALLLAPIDADTLADMPRPRIATIEPAPLVSRSKSKGLGPPARLLASASDWRALTEFSPLLEDFGRPVAAVVHAFAPPHLGSIHARLYAAFEIVVALMDVPELIDAAAHPAPRSADLPPETPAVVSATLRFADGRIASVAAGSRFPTWTRRVTLIGPEGAALLDDHSFAWLSHDGQTRDEHRDEAGADPATEAMSRTLRALLADMPPQPMPSSDAVHAMCRAATLSIRTGQPESLETFLRMA